MRLYILLLLLFALALIAGCTIADIQQTFFPAQGQEESADGYIVQDIIFPKEDAHLQKDFPLNPTVRISNTGPFESDGQVCISGLDSSSFRGFTGCECNIFQSVKEEKSFLPEDVTFGPYNILQEDSQEYTLTSIIRYKYKSTASVEMCIKENTVDMASCNSKLISAKNGPLRILSVNQITSPISDTEAAISFEIEVEKRAEGDVWDLNAVQERCRPEREIRRNVRTRIKNLPFSANSNCGDIKFDKDEATINCNLGEVQLVELSGRSQFGGSYNPQIEVEMDYAFETRTSNKFIIG